MMKAAANLRRQLAKFQEMELLVQIGEYQAGTDPDCPCAAARTAGGCSQSPVIAAPSSDSSASRQPWSGGLRMPHWDRSKSSHDSNRTPPEALERSAHTTPPKSPR